ncbi:MAG: DMT family transporter [Oscillospiraceae bacterium]|nr:DMT family transporter [Oscillospiraceae bacterium]
MMLTAVIWGTAFAFQRAGMEQIEPITFNAVRMVLSAVAVGLVAILLWLREKRKATVRSPEEAKAYNKNTLIGGICCGTFLSAASAVQQMGLVYTPAGKAGFITAMYMLLVPIISFLVFKRKNSWLVWLAVLIGVCGMYLLCITDGFSLTYGDSLVCVCAVLYSCHILSCDHFVQRGNPIRISAIQFVTAAVLSGIVALICESPTWDKIISAAIPILYCGIVSGGIGYTLQIVAQKFTDPTIASLLMSLESVFAVIAGAILLSERMSSRELAGCIVMFIAIILVQIPLPRRKKRSE